jgi:glycerophosphoryl diester phosphodiesterase
VGIGVYLLASAPMCRATAVDSPPAEPSIPGAVARVRLGPDRFLVLFAAAAGARAEDVPLQLHEVAVDGSGNVDVGRAVALRDPDRRVPFVLVDQLGPERVLTAADFDPASMQRAPDGTLWLGDQRGPFLLHFDLRGRMLDAPVGLPDWGQRGRLAGPEHPEYERSAALHTMLAVARHGRRHGGATVPVVSPNHELLADGDEATGLAVRREPPPGLPPATSEVFDVAALQAAGHRVVPWTVNDPERMDRLLDLGVDGIITDRPDLLYGRLAARADGGDGRLRPDGTVDSARFDLQGHRGARGLRPENTLPAFEAALDHLVTTLELDVGATSDGEIVVAHDPRLNPDLCRRRDGRALDSARLRDWSRTRIQAELVCDRVSPRWPRQVNDATASPISVAFAARHGLPDIHVMPTLAQVYAFAAFYAAFEGPTADAAASERRRRNAATVRFNVEIKSNPVRPDETLPADELVKATLDVIGRHGPPGRTSVQSFDFAVLLAIQRRSPATPVAFLFGDSPAAVGWDGANLEDARWRGGLPWPYRLDAAARSPLVPRNAGFRGLAWSADGARLHAMLAEPLRGRVDRQVWFFTFDLHRGEFLPVRHEYPLPPGASVVEFGLDGGGTGRVVERRGDPAVRSQWAFDPTSATPDKRKRSLRPPADRRRRGGRRGGRPRGPCAAG